MAGIIEKALAGAGKGIAQVSLIQLQSNAEENRKKRLAQFDAELEAKKPKEQYSDITQMGKDDSGAVIYGQKNLSTNEAKNVNVVKPPAPTKTTKSDREMELAKKVGDGTITPGERAELDEYQRLTEIDKIRREMTSGMSQQTNQDTSPVDAVPVGTIRKNKKTGEKQIKTATGWEPIK